MRTDSLAIQPAPPAPICARQNIVAQGDNTARPPIIIPTPEKWDPHISEAVSEWQWKLSVLAPACCHDKNSRARGLVLADLASRQHISRDGRLVMLSIRTLRRWMHDVDHDDLPALARKGRDDRNGRRCLVSREWDTACPLPEAEKTRIAGEIETYIRSLWVSGAPGAKRIEAFASSKLAELCRSAGWHDATQKNCAVGRHAIERHRGAHLVAIKERDAKRYFDIFMPRIKRNRDGLKPMDVVIGDVHPIDVVKAHEGREVHARLIAWLDLATYDIHITPVILGKGRGIRQEDIARSFVAMATDWGLPRSLYLDNGSEYKWAEMIDGFKALAGLTNAFDAVVKSASDIGELVDIGNADPAPEARAVIRAKPYNAPAKQIEGVFGILERGFFSMMPGWIGGDRMKKRTHKVGSAPFAYEGEDFERDLQELIGLYRNTKQADGSSPNDKRRAFYDQGWGPIKAAREIFMFSFSEVRRFKVHAGGIRVDGTWGTADVLIPLIGKTVDVRVAKWDRSHTFFIDEAGQMHAIPMGTSYRHGDIAGAKEQARHAGVLSEYVRALKAGTVQLKLVEEARRHNAAQPPPPALPEGPTIDLNGQGEAISNALAAAAAPPMRLLPGQQRHPTTGALFSISAPKEKGPNDAQTPFDPMKALLAIPDKKEKPSPYQRA